ncbi:hypothetical protein RN001_004511 [Aquatica leii]|uniref:DUF659 domain-containing protein n=1 Tax=Aquatica leii TaxID=1421715 RepID=A0AAN7SHH7_9COLE|nr:hypothetical protein RN001_004511 [Aquatica leii]
MEGLKIFYSKLIHVTCLPHGLHRVAEIVRAEFPAVNELISTNKKVFVKAPSRLASFREKAPNIPLPPEPILTRWGTWLEAAECYSNNFECLKQIINCFDLSDAKCVEGAQALLKKKRICKGLLFIKTYFMCASVAISSLEKKNVLLSESLKTVKTVKNNIKTVPRNHMQNLFMS